MLDNGNLAVVPANLLPAFLVVLSEDTTETLNGVQNPPPVGV